MGSFNLSAPEHPPVEAVPHIPFRCLLWGSPKTLSDYYYVLQYYEHTGSIQICGLLSDDAFFSSIYGYRLLRETDLHSCQFDLVIILSETDTAAGEMHQRALLLGIKEYDIIPCQVLKQVGFDFKKYRALKRNPPTIFSPNCWGGFTYRSLSLRFDSPFINLFLDHDEYLRFLEKPSWYLSCELRLKEYRRDTVLFKNYPVVECGDLTLHCSHYSTFDEAAAAWTRRKERIHPDNLFVMFCDEDPGRVDRFCHLPYEKKVCFVPFASNRHNVISVEWHHKNKKMKPINSTVNEMALGIFPFYNVFDLLLTNTFTPVACLR